jgi:carboxyl-terminal processing protease
MQTEHNKPNHKIRLPLYLSIALLVGFSIGIYVMPSPSINPLIHLHTSAEKVGEVSEIIRQYYFEDVTEKQLEEEAIRGMLLNLDPHSSYMTKEETMQTNSMLMGGFEGIGIQFNLFEDTLLVVSVIAGGPSETAGLLAGDRIVRVEEQNIAGVKMQNNTIIQLLRGTKGSTVKVGVLRNGVNKLLSFDITRDKIPVHSIPIYYVIAPKTGYIYIDNFTFTTAEEFHRALQEFVEQGVDKLILDLRGNPGGYLGAAIAVCDELLPPNELIVYTYGKEVGKQNYFATSKGLFKKHTQKVVVLIDEYSASASEIVAGAIQDHDRGTIIGRRSFGKGLVQRQFYLKDSSEVLITVARYYTPTGRSIQRPFDKKDNDAYYADIITRYQRGEMDSKDSIHFADSLRYVTSGGKTVYGGGGIMPDVFIPVYKSDSIVYFNKMVNQGIVFSYTMEYVDKNRKQLMQSYKKASFFVANFQVSDFIISGIVAKGKAAGIPPELSADAVKELKKWIKAYIGRSLFGEQAFYPVINVHDDMIKSAIQVLDKNATQ